MIRQKIIVIVGPTASGKSELAVTLAKKFNGEIISADSRQVYRGLNVGTGKVPGTWICKPAYTKRPRGICWFVYKEIPHYCTDFVDPKKQYSVAEFKQCAQAAIEDITKRNKTPIIVGGTGFWIDALVYDLDLPEVKPNVSLRKRLVNKSPEELLKILQKLDPGRAKTIEQKNPRRLIRAIEIAQSLGKVPSMQKKNPYNPLWIGIRLSPEELKKRIRKRLFSRLHEGLIEEAKSLRKKGLSWKRFYELGLEYKFLAEYLRNKLSKKEMIELLNTAIEQYARRQMVWFKRNKGINWVSNKKEAFPLLQKSH